MKLLRWFTLILALFALAGGLGIWAASHTANAQAGGGYDMAWNTLEGGGMAQCTGGRYALTGAFGQAEAGAALEGGDYWLEGGFWAGAISHPLYLPLILR